MLRYLPCVWAVDKGTSVRNVRSLLEDAEATLVAAREGLKWQVDLKKNLGVDIDADGTVLSVEEGSQAAAVPEVVRVGWRLTECQTFKMFKVETLAELKAEISVAKSRGLQEAQVRRAHPSSSHARAPAAL